MKPGRVCTHLDRNGRSCPNLQPCSIHPPRASTAPWSKHRPPEHRQRQRELRQAALVRDGYTCTRCGHHDRTGKTLQVHHTRATDDYRLEHAMTVCIPCHRAIDTHAR